MTLPPERKRLPIRMLLPSMVTLLALCIGLTAIRFGVEGRFDMAVYAIVFAAILDAVDGRLARALKSTSKFGAELDSLADFVNFMVVPAILLFIWALHEIGNIGWLAALLYAICGALRLARFNVALDVERPAWQVDFFTGVPAPSGACLVLFPLYVELLGFTSVHQPWLVLVFTLIVGGLMVSRIPTFSMKRVGQKVDREAVVLLLVALVAFLGLLVSFPWTVLTVCSLIYIGLIPVATLRYRRMAAQDHAARPI